MELFLKLNKTLNILIFLGIILIFSSGCKSLNSQSKTKKEVIKIGDSIYMTGYLIYDGKNGIVHFMESDSLNIEKLAKREISKLISNSRKIVLLRAGLKDYRNSEFISLTLCYRDERFIVKNNDLLFSRYYITRLEKFLFYKVDRKYEDKERFVFCKI